MANFYNRGGRGHFLSPSGCLPIFSQKKKKVGRPFSSEEESTNGLPTHAASLHIWSFSGVYDELIVLTKTDGHQNMVRKMQHTKCQVSSQVHRLYRSVSVRARHRTRGFQPREVPSNTLVLLETKEVQVIYGDLLMFTFKTANRM